MTRIFKSGHPQVMRGNSGIDKLLSIVLGVWWLGDFCIFFYVS